jgi:hypothetical protein
MPSLRSLLLFELLSFELLSGFLSLLFLNKDQLGLTLLFLHCFHFGLGHVEINGGKIRLDLLISIVFADDFTFLFDVISDS